MIPIILLSAIAVLALTAFLANAKFASVWLDRQITEHCTPDTNRNT